MLFTWDSLLSHGISLYFLFCFAQCYLLILLIESRYRHTDFKSSCLTNLSDFLKDYLFMLLSRNSNTFATTFSKFHVIIYLEIRGLVKIQEILRVPAPRGIGFFINFSLATRVEITPLAIHGDFQRLRHLHNRYLINTIIKINPQKTEFLKSRNWYLLDLMRRFSDRMFFSHLFWNRWSYSGQ